MCERLWVQVNKHGFVIIKAPPQSGKTSLLQLFQQYVTVQLRISSVFFFNPARASRPFDFNNEFEAQCGVSLDNILKGKRCYHLDCMLVITIAVRDEPACLCAFS
jgi:hypothetical protein